MFKLKAMDAARFPTIAPLDGARGSGPSTALPVKEAPALARMTQWFARRRAEKQVLASYQELFEADDHILADAGVTRLEVFRLIEASAGR